MINRKIPKLELRRQIFHAALGLAIIILLVLDLIGAWYIFIALLFGGLLAIMSRNYKIPVVCWFLKKFERKLAFKKLPGKGPILYFIGILLALQLFPKDIALASIAILAFGDSASHLVGKYFGTIKHPLSSKRVLEGSLAGLIAGFVGAAFFVAPLEAFVAALAGMIIEVLEIEVNRQLVDDNVTVPLAAGTAMIVLRVLIK